MNTLLHLHVPTDRPEALPKNLHLFTSTQSARSTFSCSCLKLRDICGRVLRLRGDEVNRWRGQRVVEVLVHDCAGEEGTLKAGG